MRAYHNGVDHWTVLDDDGHYEYTVTPPDKTGKRKILNTATRREPGTYVRNLALATVEARAAQIGDTDWSTP